MRDFQEKLHGCCLQGVAECCTLQERITECFVNGIDSNPLICTAQSFGHVVSAKVQSLVELIPSMTEEGINALSAQCNSGLAAACTLQERVSSCLTETTLPDLAACIAKAWARFGFDQIAETATLQNPVLSAMNYTHGTVSAMY